MNKLNRAELNFQSVLRQTSQRKRGAAGAQGLTAQISGRAFRQHLMCDAGLRGLFDPAALYLL